MSLRRSTRRTVILLLSITLALAAVITLTAPMRAQEPPSPVEQVQANPDATKRRLPTTMLWPTAPDDTYAVELSGDITSATGTPGALIEFTVTVVNMGDVQDTYDFTLTNSGTWLTTLGTPTVTLDPGIPYLLPVQVEVPTDAVAGESVILTVTATSSGDPGVSNDIDLLATAVASPTCTGCDPIIIESESDSGSYMSTITATAEINSLAETSGLIAPFRINGTIAQDPTRWDPFDDLGDHLLIFTDTIPAGALRVVAEILSTTAPDADLYLGFDDNDDGLPQSSEVLCAPFLLGSSEYCSLEEPQGGVWWVIVQASYASGDGVDAVEVAWAVIDEDNIDNEALGVNGPSSVPAGQPLDLTLEYDLASFNPEPGDVFYGGFSIGSEPGNPTDIDNIVPVDVRYLGGPPQILLTPHQISVTLPLGEQSEQSLTIANSGGDRTLHWDIGEDAQTLSGPATSHEIVRDGSFELGSPNPYWFEGGDFVPPLCSPGLCGQDYARSGDWYAWFGGFGVTNTNWISQNVTIPTAPTALLSFYLFMNGNPGQNMGQFQVLIDGNPVATYDEDSVANFLYGYERAAIDISVYADGNTHELMFIFHEISATGIVDDVSIEVDVSLTCITPQEVSWLSLSTHSGAIPPGDSDEVEVHLDTDGLAPGAYNASLCIASDDPETPLRQVPVTLTVRHISYLPVIVQLGE